MGKIIDETDLMNLLYTLDDARHDLSYAIKKIPELPPVEIDKCINDHKKIEKIAAILKTAKADPTRDEYAEYYLDAIEEVVRWTQI